MSVSPAHVETLGVERLLGMRRGIEKESLRVLPNGSLALTPHPLALGSALTHPSITTDYSESQLELITGAHQQVSHVLAELTELHQFVLRTLNAASSEMLWVSSMPCGLPTDETIPIGRYGTSNIGRAKSVYRVGLGHRYGRRMQTISGIHYNWSLPGLTNEDYLGLIRNFRRHSFLLLLLFGASPAVCSSFLEGREHSLQTLPSGCMYRPHATSLRMGRLGYQSEAQASLSVSYNSLESYAASLHEALTRPYPPYEAIGIRGIGGEYNQLATTLLQIENEFYSTIRPKRTIRPGERPLHALRERGIEYVEVRLMDLNPFLPLGIDASTMRFLDIFLLHALLAPSPPDKPEEIQAIASNQQRTAERGREPGLRLIRAGQEVLLIEWAQELLAAFEPIAQGLDRLGLEPKHAYVEAWHEAVQRLDDFDQLPSARVLNVMAEQHAQSFIAFTLAQSEAARDYFLAQPWTLAQQERFMQQSALSLAEQRQVEASDRMPFEDFRRHYISAARLTPAPDEEELVAGVSL